MLNKIFESLDKAVADIPDGATIMVGGFGDAGMPYGLLEALIRHHAKHLTLISNHAGRGEEGIAQLIRQGRVRKMICSYPTAKSAVVLSEFLRAGKIEHELVPQGTLAERIRKPHSPVNRLPGASRRTCPMAHTSTSALAYPRYAATTSPLIVK